MRLAEYLDRQLLLADLAAGSKEEALRLLVEPVAQRFPEITAEAALAVLHAREKLGSTGIGDGIAIPHGKLAELPRLVVLPARSLGGVPFDALDHKPCRLLFLVLAPENGAGLHLRLLAHISRLARDPLFHSALLEAPDEDAFWNLISSV